MRCLVVRNTGSDYQVCAENGELFSCKIKGNFRLKNIKSTNPIAIGDWVIIDANNEVCPILPKLKTDATT